MNNETKQPYNHNSSKHPTLSSINFYSYPSEYSFSTPTPLKVMHWPRYVPKPSKRRNRSRQTNTYLKHNVPKLSKPIRYFILEPQYDNIDQEADQEVDQEVQQEADEEVDEERDVQSNEIIVNLNSVTETQIDNMSFVEYADYVSNVISFGEELVIKYFPNSNYKLMKDNRCEMCFEEQNPSSPFTFRGKPWATNDFSFALKRLKKTWLMLKPYMEYQNSVYHTRTSSTFKNYFTECQTNNKRLMIHLLKTAFKLETVKAFQKVSTTTNITPHSKSFHTTSNTIVEFSNVSNESKTNYQTKTDLYFGLNRNEDFHVIAHFEQQEEKEADTYFTINETEKHSLTEFVDNQQEVEGFDNFPQSDFKCSETDSCFDLNQNEALNLTFADHQHEGETFSNSELKNYEKEPENRIFTFSPEESSDIKKWSTELLKRTEEISSSAFQENNTSKENSNILVPKTNKNFKNNSFVVGPTNDFNIQMKNYRYPVEFTHKVKNIHLNVKKLLKEDKIAKINVSSTLETETKEKQEKIRYHCYNFFAHGTKYQNHK